MSSTLANPVRIYVASHLPIPIPENEKVSVVQAGSSESASYFKLKDSDSKDNISHLNPVYSELTVQYMLLSAEVNLLPEKIGFMHYRRFLIFANPLSTLLVRLLARFPTSRWGYYQRVTMCLDSKKLEKVVKNVDLIIPKPLNVGALGFQSIRAHYAYHHFESDWEVCSQKIKELYPALHHEFSNLSTYSNLYIGNIYIMSRSLFIEYGSLLFKILEEVRSEIDLQARTIQEARALGYLAERIFTAFVQLKRNEGKTRIKEVHLTRVDPPKNFLPSSVR